MDALYTVTGISRFSHASGLCAHQFFDTESPGNGSATGFVVDAERGIILTNRHVVGPGPIVRHIDRPYWIAMSIALGWLCAHAKSALMSLQDAEAVFQNNEEVRIIPIYRDPVHDFGFFQYDPSVRGLRWRILPVCC